MAKNSLLLFSRFYRLALVVAWSLTVPLVRPLVFSLPRNLRNDDSIVRVLSSGRVRGLPALAIHSMTAGTWHYTEAVS